MTEKKAPSFLGDLFGETSFSDLLDGRIFGNRDKTLSFHRDPKGEALYQTFTEGIEKEEIGFLDQAITSYQEEIRERKSDTNLLETYVKAAVLVGRLKISYDSLGEMNLPDPKHHQAMGLIAHELGDYNTAAKHFNEIEEEISPIARIVYATTLFRCGESSLEKYEKVLSPILEESIRANTFLGTLSFNQGEFEAAEKYFSQAVELNPNSENTHLDLMRTKLANGKQTEVYSQMSKFYVKTGSTLSVEKLKEELGKKELTVPSPKIKNLFKIVNATLV